MTLYVDSLDFACNAAKATRWHPPLDYAPTADDQFGFCRNLIVTALRAVEYQA